MFIQTLFIQFSVILLTTLSGLRTEEVLELTDYDFYPRIAEYEYTLALFYAPWCKRCRRLLPEYSEAASELIKHSPPILLVKIDCTEESDHICEKFAKDTYPTLKFFKNGELMGDYSGPYTSYGITKYTKAQVRPTSIEISRQDVEELIKSMRDPFIVGYFAADSSMRSIFLETAEILKVKLQFFHINIYGDGSIFDNKIVLYQPQYLSNKFENASLVYKGDSNATNLYQFIIKHMHGLVGIRKLNNQEDFVEPIVIIYFSLDYKLNPKRTNYWRNRVLQIAKEFENNVSFAISPSNEFSADLRAIGIDLRQAEKPVVVARKSGRKYLLQDEFSKETLKNFVKDFLAGSLQPIVKSEPIPEKQTEPVVVAVAKNFEQVVEQNGRDTLIKFHAPWCGHCKSLAPAYKELAEKLKDEDVVIVEMNAEANDVPYPYTVTGYPTIYWAPKNKKSSPSKYEGGRTVEDFIKFIAKEASEELVGWDRNGNMKNIKEEL